MPTKDTGTLVAQDAYQIGRISGPAKLFSETLFKVLGHSMSDQSAPDLMSRTHPDFWPK